MTIPGSGALKLFGSKPNEPHWKCKASQAGRGRGVWWSSGDAPWLLSQRALRAKGNIEPKQFEESHQGSAFITKRRPLGACVRKGVQVKLACITYENALSFTPREIQLLRIVLAVVLFFSHTHALPQQSRYILRKEAERPREGKHSKVRVTHCRLTFKRKRFLCLWLPCRV